MASRTPNREGLERGSRFGAPPVGEIYDESGSLIVGEIFPKHTPAHRRRLNARGMALFHVTENNNDILAIAVGLYPEPEDESQTARTERIMQTRRLAMRLADRGFYDVAIELGVLPLPRVEAEPRMVDESGKLIQEAAELAF